MLKYGPGAEEVQKNVGCPGSHGVQCGPGGLKKEERKKEEERKSGRGEVLIPSLWLKVMGKLGWVTIFDPKGKAPEMGRNSM